MYWTNNFSEYRLSYFGSDIIRNKESSEWTVGRQIEARLLIVEPSHGKSFCNNKPSHWRSTGSGQARGGGGDFILCMGGRDGDVMLWVCVCECVCGWGGGGVTRSPIDGRLSLVIGKSRTIFVWSFLSFSFHFSQSILFIFVFTLFFFFFLYLIYLLFCFGFRGGGDSAIQCRLSCHVSLCPISMLRVRMIEIASIQNNELSKYRPPLSTL